MAESIQTCVAKVGEPDIERGMRTCGRPVFYAVTGQIVDGEPAAYSGWRHVYADDYDHGAVNAGWI